MGRGGMEFVRFDEGGTTLQPLLLQFESKRVPMSIAVWENWSTILNEPAVVSDDESNGVEEVPTVLM